LGRVGTLVTDGGAIHQGGRRVDLVAGVDESEVTTGAYLALGQDRGGLLDVLVHQGWLWRRGGLRGVAPPVVERVAIVIRAVPVSEVEHMAQLMRDQLPIDLGGLRERRIHNGDEPTGGVFRSAGCLARPGPGRPGRV